MNDKQNINGQSQTTGEDTTSISLEEKRKLAAIAMAGREVVQNPLEELRQNRAKKEEEKERVVLGNSIEQLDSMEIAKKRMEAKRAMEGKERRVAREEAERIAKEQAQQEESLQRKSEADQVRQEIAEREQEIQEQIKQKQEVEQSAQTQKGFEEVVKKAPILSSIRTLKQDIDRHIAQGNISGIKMAVMEDEKRRGQQQKEPETQTPEQKTKRLIKLVILFIIVVAGFATLFVNRQPILGYFSSFFEDEDGQMDTIQTTEPLIFVETTKILNLTDKTPRESVAIVRNEIKNADLKLGAIEEIVLVKNGQPIESLIGFYNSLNMVVPDAFVRLIDDTEFSFGLYSSIENGGFFILKTKFLEKSYAELLLWEKGMMARDLLPILNPKTPTDEILRKDFTDELIKNINVRILTDEDGDEYMLYAFLDKDILVMAGNRPTFLEVLRRYNTPKPIAK